MTKGKGAAKAAPKKPAPRKPRKAPEKKPPPKKPPPQPRGAKPGERRGGRQKGTQNKLTVTIKEAVLEAFVLLGGVREMVKWAKDGHQGEFYRIVARLIPTEVTGKNGGPVWTAQSEAPPVETVTEEDAEDAYFRLVRGQA